MKVINLISGPRNISTALMYSFASRPDFQVQDEPFYGYYLSNASLSITHPLDEEIKDTMETDRDQIIAQIQNDRQSSHLFLKGMAHHFLDTAPDYLLSWDNVILIRHPRKLIASFSKVIENPGLKDIGIKKAAELFLYLQENGATPLVIDSDELMVDPERYLRILCDRLGLSFDPAMLTWPKGGIAEDGIWAPFWYKNVHNTTGFKVQQKTAASVPPALGPLLAEAMPYYETLKQHILINE